MKEKRVFITGGAHGIGRSIVDRFCQQGNQVVFCDIDDTRSLKTAYETGAHFIHADVSVKEELEATMKTVLNKWGDIDILINNAGISTFKPLTQTTVDEFDHVINTNLRSAFITSQILARHRQDQSKRNDYGRIINLCSTRYLQSEPGTEAYSASKGGIWSLTHALAVSLAPLHITVNCIAPGWIHVNEQETLRPEDHAFHLSGRVGKPGDIARTCLFLCEPENDFINGQCITVDGGVTKTMIYPE